VATVSFCHAGRGINVAADVGEDILTVARRAGMALESPCNGNGTCGKCKVKLTAADGQHTVLACRTAVSRDMTVEIMERRDGGNLQIKQDGMIAVVNLDSAIKKRYLPLADLTEVYRDGNLIATEHGDTLQQVYGLAVDIGTTTLVVSLVDLLTGQELATAGALNPQSRLAQDVLSRIRYASDEQGLAEMNRLCIDELNRLIQQVTAVANVIAVRIYDLVFSGNTCMLHLAAGVNPATLGKYPYTPLIWGGAALPAADLGIHAAAGAEVYLPQVISAYVGADITSGILVSRLAERNGVSLFIDIGTNGEMVLAVDGMLAATSTAAGPAFEGMNIACGMRAAPGAIEGFSLTPAGGRIVETIGAQPAIGICGSGLLDIVAELVKYELIEKNGKFSKKLPGKQGDLITVIAGKPAFAVTDEVFVSQQDVRQVQLAKGAIRAGIEALLAYRGLKVEAVGQVLIAGSFGFHLNPVSLIGIGLLPEAFQGKIEFLGNTSMTGGQAFLVNRECRLQAARTVADVAVLELATVANFDRLFVNCLEF
jgi:uncharacterized 2Fe-2S/4Fe-4S cluster protein (DUF4445 family)